MYKLGAYLYARSCFAMSNQLICAVPKDDRYNSKTQSTNVVFPAPLGSSNFAGVDRYRDESRKERIDVVTYGVLSR